MTKYCLLVLFLVLFYVESVAQQPQVIHYKESEGYPPSSATSMIQDKHGWLWFAAEYEILRFDGHKFKNYPPAKGVAFHYAFDVLEVEGEIWINAIPYMLKVDGDSLRRLDIKNNFLPLSVDTDDISSVLTLGGKTFFLCNNGIYQLQKKELVPFITDSQIDVQGRDDFCAFNDSLILARDIKKNILYVFNLNEHNFHIYPGAITGLKKIDGTVFIIKPGIGILKVKTISFDNSDVKFGTALKASVASDEPLLFFNKDGQGNFWLFYKNEKLLRITADDERQLISERDGWRDLVYLSSFRDQEKNLWVLTRSDLIKIPEQQWNRYSKSDALLSNNVKGITPGIEINHILVNTEEGVCVIEHNIIHHIVNRFGKPLEAYSVIGRNGRLIYSLDNQLITATFDPKTFATSEEKILCQLPSPVVNFTFDRKNYIYLSSHAGLYVFHESGLQKLSNASYMVLFIDSSDRLWAGKFAFDLDCYQLHYDMGKPRIDHLLSLDSINNRMPRINGIRALGQDRLGNIIVGTRYSGLFTLSLANNKVTRVNHFDKSTGLKSNSVWDLDFDRTGLCWIATSGGVNSLQFLNDRWVIKDESKKRRIHSVSSILVSNDNKIWVNSFPGVVCFEPKQNEMNSPFSIFITSVRVNNKPYNTRKKNKFSGDKNDLSVEFSANTFRYEQELKYTWRINEGDAWSEPSYSHAINFSHLKPGQYHFRVKAINAFDQWSTNEAGFDFVIIPPLWQRPWFIGFISLALISILYILYRYRINQIKKFENLRSNIAKDLHDEIGSDLTSISILSRVSRSSLHTDKAKSEKLLQTVIDQSRKMQQNISDIVWTIRPDNDKMKSMVTHIREYLSRTLEPAGIRFQFSVDETLLQKGLGMQYRRDFFLIFKEAINNILRHSKADEVNMSLSFKNELIHLKICDNGIGIDTDSIKTGNGLHNMKTRSALLKGELKIYNGKDRGCCVELILPIG